MKVMEAPRRYPHKLGASAGLETEKLPVDVLLRAARAQSTRSGPMHRLVAPLIPQPKARMSSQPTVRLSQLPIAARAVYEAGRADQVAVVGATSGRAVKGAPIRRKSSKPKAQLRVGSMAASSRLRALADAMGQTLESALEGEGADLAAFLSADQAALELAGSLVHIAGKLVIDVRIEDSKDGRVVAAASVACEEGEAALANAAKALLKKLAAKARATL